MLVLVGSEFLGQFIDILTADHKYSPQNRDNLWPQISRQRSQKLNTYSQFFIAFLKFTLNLEYFEKKDQSHSLSITEIINCETGTYLNVRKSMFHATLSQITC